MALFFFGYRAYSLYVDVHSSLSPLNPLKGTLSQINFRYFTDFKYFKLGLHLYNLIHTDDYNRPAKRFSEAYENVKKVVGGIFDLDAKTIQNFLQKLPNQ
jgi:hypothetical protein